MVCFTGHDKDPFEKKQKEILAQQLTPYFCTIPIKKSILILFSCATAYFEKRLFSQLRWELTYIYIIEDPHIPSHFRLEICQELQCHFGCPVGWIEGCLPCIKNLFQCINVQESLVIGLNIVIFQRFHLFDDVLLLYKIDYFLISFPFMGKCGQSLFFCSNIGFKITPQPMLDTNTFYIVSNLAIQQDFINGL